jgi:hypothetical protein
MYKTILMLTIIIGVSAMQLERNGLFASGTGSKSAGNEKTCEKLLTPLLGQKIEITLKNMEKISGKLIRVEKGRLTLESRGKEIQINYGELKALKRGKSGAGVKIAKGFFWGTVTFVVALTILLANMGS